MGYRPSGRIERTQSVRSKMDQVVAGQFADLPERYEFQVAKGKYKQFTIVKKLIKGTDTVINACDMDREGSISSIVFIIKQAPKTKR